MTKKVPFMIFIEELRRGGGLYFVYSRDEYGDCNCIHLTKGHKEEPKGIKFAGCDLSSSYLEGDCHPFGDLEKNTLDYLKVIFRDHGYNPEVLGDQVDSLEDLEDLTVAQFENLAKIRVKESVGIKDDGTPDFDKMTKEEKDKFLKDLYSLFKSDQKVFEGAPDDGEDMNDLKIDRWNESLNLDNIGVEKTLEDERRESLNRRKSAPIKKIHTWVPGVIRESKFDRYSEDVLPVDEHKDTEDYIGSLDLLGESKEVPLSRVKESAPNFMKNEGPFPLVVKELNGDDFYTLECPNCGDVIYNSPNEEGIRTCDNCGYEVSPEEWKDNAEYDDNAQWLEEDFIIEDFKDSFNKSPYSPTNLKCWKVSLEPGRYQGLQVYVSRKDFDVEGEEFPYGDYLIDFLRGTDGLSTIEGVSAKDLGIDPQDVENFLESKGGDSNVEYYDEFFESPYNKSKFKSADDLFDYLEEYQRNFEAEKVNDFLDLLCRDYGYTKLKVDGIFSNGEAVYSKVKESSKKGTRLQEGPGSAYSVYFYGIKLDNVKITERGEDKYGTEQVSFEADVVPGDYEWSADGYDWAIGTKNPEYNPDNEFYDLVNIFGGKVTGECINGTQAFSDENAKWDDEDFLNEIKGESYDLGVIYGGGWSHADITSPFHMEDYHGDSVDISDDRSGYKNSYIKIADLDLDADFMNQAIEDTRYADLYSDDDEDYLEESKLKEADRDYIKIGNKVYPNKGEDLGSISVEEVLKDTKRNYDLEQKEQEDSRRKEELGERGSEIYSKAVEAVENSDGTEDKLSVLFDLLVPSRGKADTVAGEIVRAINRIVYRYWNDGDLFYKGYGEETCGSSASYLAKVVPGIKEDFLNLVEEEKEEGDYFDDLLGIGNKIVDYLVNSPEVFEEPNEDNSVSFEKMDFGYYGYDEDEDEEDEDYLDESLKGKKTLKERKDRYFHRLECKFYDYAAPYFVNDDPSGLSDEDIEEVDLFYEAIQDEFPGIKSAYCVDVRDDSDFGSVELPLGRYLSSYKGHKFLRGDVCTYVFQVEVTDPVDVHDWKFEDGEDK